MTQLYTIPFRVGPEHFSLMVVLMDANIERIKERDPAEVVLSEIMLALGEPFTGLRLSDVVITYATPEEMQTCIDFLSRGQRTMALKLLTRGYRYRPDEGDGMPPISRGDDPT